METTQRNRLVLALVAVAVVAALIALFVVASDDDDDTTISGPPTTTGATSSTPSTTSTTTAPPNVSGEEAATIVWPDPGGDLAYDDPGAAARGAAEGLLDFQDPLYGELHRGDSRSGEIEVRPSTDGPTTTLLVRQMSDGHWYVIGATSSEIELAEPTAASAIDHPLQVSGRARASEGVLDIAIFGRGDTAPLGEGQIATSGASDLTPFVGEVSWDNPGGGWGTVVVTVPGADGTVQAGTALPVGFIGGD